MPLIIFHLFHHIAFDLPICKDLKTSAPYLDVDEYFLGEDLPKNNQSISLSTENDENLSLARLDEYSTIYIHLTFPTMTLLGRGNRKNSQHVQGENTMCLKHYVGVLGPLSWNSHIYHLRPQDLSGITSTISINHWSCHQIGNWMLYQANISY